MEEIPQDRVALFSRALEQRTEVKEARLKEKQAEYDFRLKKSEYLPEVSLAFHYVSLANIEVLPRNAASVGLVFSWDPFDWGRRKRELAAKSKIIEQADHGVHQAEAQVLLDASKQYRRLQESQALVHASRLGEEVAREKLRVATERYKAEAALVREVLQSQASLAEASNHYRRALLSYWTARADLEKALGED
jgi:outer membrane protein TolC